MLKHHPWKNDFPDTGLYTGTGFFYDLANRRSLGLLEMAEAWALFDVLSWVKCGQL